MKGLRGFTLIELVVTTAILAILAAVASMAYNSQIEKGRLADARAALTQDGHFLERWYPDNGTYYKQSSSAWPTLPVTETEYYSIDFTSLASGADGGSYTLQATAKPLFGGPEAKYLKLDQNGNMLTCTKPGGGTEHCEL